jgi:hypothetical protein
MVPFLRRLPHTISPLEGDGFEPSVPDNTPWVPSWKISIICVVPRFGYLISAPVDAALLSNLPPGGGNVMIRPSAVPNDSWITNG